MFSTLPNRDISHNVFYSIKKRQSPKNPLIRSSLLGKTWSGQVDYPSLSNWKTSVKWQEDEYKFWNSFEPERYRHCSNILFDVCKCYQFHPVQNSVVPKRQILDSSKLEEFADNNFEFDGNGRKSSKRVENTVGKGEIARYEQFLLFPQCFQKTCTGDT